MDDVASRIGFIGLGSLGSEIAHKIIDAGLELFVWNRSRAKADPLVDRGARFHLTPTAVIESSDIVLICVSDADAVAEVTFGRDGLACRAAAGKIIVDHSSIHPDHSRKFHNEMSSSWHCDWLDAPVSGGPNGARNGTLTVMAGGTSDAFNRVKPILEVYTEQYTLVGPPGSGQAAKLCNQIIVAANLWGAAEATLFAETQGIDPLRLTDILSGGFADTPIFRLWQPHMAGKADPPSGRTALLLKDLDACLELGRRSGCPLPTTANATELIRSFLTHLDEASPDRLPEFLSGRRSEKDFNEENEQA